MAALVGAKSAYAPMANGEDTIRIVYDFAVDGGATGALDVFTASEALIVTHAHLTVKTTATSGGSATLKWGPSADDDRFCDTTQGAVASLTAGATVVPPALEGTPNVLPVPFKMAAGGKLIQTIGTAALTAGKVEYVLRVIKP
jgi:hypothetical protein